MKPLINRLLGLIGYRILRVSTISGKDRRIFELQQALDEYFWREHKVYIERVLLPRAEKSKELSSKRQFESVVKAFENGQSRWTPSMLLLLELDCLSRLNSLDWPKEAHKPFPEIMDYSLENGTIAMTDCGKSIDRLDKPVTVPNTKSQITKILNALDACGIEHHDMDPSGKNLCVSQTGNLSIIDFAWSTVAGWSLPELPSKGRDATEETILEILRDNPLIRLR